MKIILNACKNILVVVQVVDRPLFVHVLRALYLEWSNPNYCMSYGGYSGKKEDLLQITVKTKVAFYALRKSLEILIVKQF